MSSPKRQSVDRRGFLAAMVAASAAVGAFALSTREADAVAPTAAPTGSTARATSQRARASAHAAHTVGENTMLDQMTSAQAQDTAIRPFVVDVPEADLDDLRRRLAATRWPDQETVGDASQGAPLAKLRPLVQYWATDYDWRKAEAKLNAFPQFKTQIDGVDIHCFTSSRATRTRSR